MSWLAACTDSTMLVAEALRVTESALERGWCMKLGWCTPVSSMCGLEAEAGRSAGDARGAIGPATKAAAGEMTSASSAKSIRIGVVV